MNRAPSPPRSLPPGSPRASAVSLDASFLVRPPSTVSELSQQVEPSPAYMLEWSGSGCRRTWIAGPDDLRAAVEAGSGTGDSAAASALRLLVLHGLPADLVRTLRACVDIDPAFVESHAGRRSYRPRRWRRDARWAHYDFPELVRGHVDPRPDSSSSSFAGFPPLAFPHTASAAAVANTTTAATAIDLMFDPPAYPISSADEQAVLFFRASLWMAPQANVLFIDRPVWRDPTSAFRKSRRRVSVTKP